MQRSYTHTRIIFITLTLSLFAVTLGGTITFNPALANVPNNSVTTGKILDGEVKMNDLGVDSVTSDKIKNSEIKAEDVSLGFMRFARLLDDAAGNALGWNPGITFRFKVQDMNVNDNSVVAITIDTSGLGGTGPICSVSHVKQGMFAFFCNTNIGEGTALNYAVINPKLP